MRPAGRPRELPPTATVRAANVCVEQDPGQYGDARKMTTKQRDTEDLPFAILVIPSTLTIWVSLPEIFWASPRPATIMARVAMNGTAGRTSTRIPLTRPAPAPTSSRPGSSRPAVALGGDRVDQTLARASKRADRQVDAAADSSRRSSRWRPRRCWPTGSVRSARWTTAGGRAGRCPGRAKAPTISSRAGRRPGRGCAVPARSARPASGRHCPFVDVLAGSRHRSHGCP